MVKSKVPEWLVKASERIIEHLNDVHSNSIVSTLNIQHSITNKNAKMEKLRKIGTLPYQIEKDIF